MNRAFRSRVVALALPVAVLALSGCGEDSGPTAPGSGLTSPDQVVSRLAEVWQQKDSVGLQAILAPDFEFHVRDDQVSDFPWLSQPWWDRTEELGAAGHLFDPSYSVTGPPVQSIEFDYTVLQQSEPQPGIHAMTVDAVITVLTGPSSGWIADTRFDLSIEKQADGFLQVAEMKEVPRLDPLRGAPSAVELTTWADIKALYRRDPYDGIAVQLGDPDYVVASMVAAWKLRNLLAMDALLAPDFEFHVRDDKVTQFPWLPQGQPWWDRAQELAMAGNMFDPGFTGAQPGVESIDFQENVIGRRQVTLSVFECTIDAVVTVLTGPADGWASDTRLVLTIERQPDRFLRISRVQEVAKLDPGRSGTASTTTWGEIKALYR